ncbi:Fe-S oxidoreductase [Curtobacterium sp. 'Ferrero']|nr:Fe-S oxidoreductase [Curtobacterium sp. 'Ferrero']
MAPAARDLRPTGVNPFVDSPLSRAGWAFATAVGLAVGLPLSTGPVRVVDGLVVCSGLPRWAFRRGGTCVGSVYLTRDNDDERVLRHERVHVDQWKRYGMAMPLLYAIAGRDPLRNRFEVEAGLEDGGYVR